MNKLALKFLVILAQCAVLGIVFNLSIGENWRREQRFGKLVRAQKGKSLEDAQRALGKPFRANDMTAYRAARSIYASSLEPDPPLVECDHIYHFQEYATIGMLFVRNGVIIETYVGGT